MSEVAAELTVLEESVELASSLSMGNTELVRPTLRQGPTTSPASPAGVDREQSEVDEGDTEESLILLDTSEPWKNSLWPRGAWVDGLEVIDALRWAHPKPT